jgi:hypothetical protein
MHSIRRESSRHATRYGMMIPINIAMIPIATRNSISVNPLLILFTAHP